jgi:hypothetical protein
MHQLFVCWREKNVKGHNDSVVDRSVYVMPVGKEMPISRIVVAVPNATVVLLD